MWELAKCGNETLRFRENIVISFGFWIIGFLKTRECCGFFFFSAVFGQTHCNPFFLLPPLEKKDGGRWSP